MGSVDLIALLFSARLLEQWTTPMLTGKQLRRQHGAVRLGWRGRN